MAAKLQASTARGFSCISNYGMIYLLWAHGGERHHRLRNTCTLKRIDGKLSTNGQVFHTVLPSYWHHIKLFIMRKDCPLSHSANTFKPNVLQDPDFPRAICLYVHILPGIPCLHIWLPSALSLGPLLPSYPECPARDALPPRTATGGQVSLLDTLHGSPDINVVLTQFHCHSQVS
jgi:hypothetical protein